MKDDELAPILMFVYDRPNHARKALEALSNNNLATDSILYIYCDGIKKNPNKGQRERIAETRKAIREKRWCREVNIIESDINQGCKNAVINGVTEIINRHNKVIVVEDDIITGKYFLEYMNYSLKTYFEDKKVFGIGGNLFRHSGKLKAETYFLPLSSPWGYAFWADRWNSIDFIESNLMNEVLEKNKRSELLFGGTDYYKMLEAQCNGELDTWDIQVYVNMILQEKFFLYPRKALSYNIGFDGSGVHCVADEKMQSQKMNLAFRPRLKKIPLIVNEKILAKFNKDFNKENFLKQFVNRVRTSYKVKGLLSLINKLKKTLK